MADAFTMRWKLDRPYLEQDTPGDVYALLTIEPNPTVLGAPSAAATIPTHLILLVDVSESMDVLVRRDPNAQKVGAGSAEGKVAQRVVSDVPSRREMACDVVQKMVERLQGDDLLTLVAFDDTAHVLAQAVSPNDMDTVWSAIRKLSSVGGGGTAMGTAFESVRDILTNANDAPRTRKLVLLTDGEDQEPDSALASAKAVGWDFHLPIVAFGTGECKVAFLTDLAKTSLAGAFNHIRDETVAQQLFGQVVKNQKNIQATNVQLQLWLSPELQVRELYRTKPEILFVGDVQPDSQHQAVLRLEQMERGKAYEFLFRCSLPGRPVNQRFRIAKAILTYDVPSVNKTGEKLESNIVVESTADPARAAERSGDVRKVLARAEVQRQVLFLQTKIDALKGGGGTLRDREIAAKLLEALIKKFEDFGDQATANQYRAMKDEFSKKGTISQEMLNRSLAATSRAEETIVPQDIDF
ncbi:MAG: VWA domain-containing protein [Gemmataceae bacterium]|nr:VWA domain-containing protein [Gemmataceae bacterium]